MFVLIASSFGIALAQASGPTPVDSIDPWLKAGVAICSLWALMWVLQHLLRVTIPHKEKMFQATLDKIIERSEKHDEQFRELLTAHTQRCELIQQRWVDQSGGRE
jgi:hypothetical protein